MKDVNEMTDVDTIAKIIHNANLFTSQNVQYLVALTFLDHLNNK